MSEWESEHGHVREHGYEHAQVHSQEESAGIRIRGRRDTFQRCHRNVMPKYCSCMAWRVPIGVAIIKDWLAAWAVTVSVTLCPGGNHCQGRMAHVAE